MHKQLIKTKRISESPEFARLERSLKSIVSSSTTGAPRDPAEANVTARLFKSNPVQNVLPDILTDIRTLLGVNEVSKKQQQQRKQQKVEEAEEKEDEDKRVKKPDVDMERSQSVPSDSGQLNDSDDDDDTNMADAPDEDDDESLDFSQFDGRLAPTSDASEGEGGEEEEEEEDEEGGHNLADDISISSSASSGSLEIPQRVTSLAKNPKTKKHEPPKDTTFLPSLTMGGYWSGSESGDDDSIGAADTAGKPQPRKNRMGQQARRALWEKKYGAKANHIQKEKQQADKKNKKNKNSGWDMRRGAMADDNYKPKWAKQRDGDHHQSSGFAKRKDDYRESNDNDNRPVTRPNKATSASLHPSWEAARKAKEQKKQASFQGKKIVFD